MCELEKDMTERMLESCGKSHSPFPDITVAMRYLSTDHFMEEEEAGGEGSIFSFLMLSIASAWENIAMKGNFERWEFLPFYPTIPSKADKNIFRKKVLYFISLFEEKGFITNKRRINGVVVCKLDAYKIFHLNDVQNISV